MYINYLKPYINIKYNMNIEAIQQLVKYEYEKCEEELFRSIDKQKASTNKFRRLRLTLEPYIFNLLILRYGQKLDEFWKSYLPPKRADKAFVIVERRCHPNFWFVLRNIAWANPNMSVYIFCSDVNINFLKGLIGDKIDNFNLIQVFKGDPSLEEAIKDYNNFLTSWKMYETIDAEWSLLVQMDVFIRRKLPDSIFVGEYWGYPFGWRPDYAGGGGAIVRNIKKLYELCKQHRPNCEENVGVTEDVWFCEKMLETGATVPSFDFRRDHIMENVPSIDPYVVHQFWTYIDFFKGKIDSDIFKNYWDHILTFEI